MESYVLSNIIYVKYFLVNSAPKSIQYECRDVDFVDFFFETRQYCWWIKLKMKRLDQRNNDVDLDSSPAVS